MEKTFLFESHSVRNAFFKSVDFIIILIFSKIAVNLYFDYKLSSYLYLYPECNTGSYGAGCSETCSNTCAGPDSDCHHVTGTCTAGCDPGFWGDKCSQSCSSHCAGLDNACNRDTGACTGGCEVGYWGENCLQSCSSHCVRPDNACNRDTGACTGGCEPGYKAPNCDQSRYLDRTRYEAVYLSENIIYFLNRHLIN